MHRNLVVADYISPILSVEDSHSRIECINTMMDNLCYELPVMKEGKLYGTVQLDECIHSKDETISNLVDPGYASVHFNSHIFDVLRIFNESNADVCGVLGEYFEWIGIVTKTRVLEALSQSLTSLQTGAVLIVEMAAHQYSSSQISRIIESEGAQLLGLWLTDVADSSRIRASLKLNTQNAERIIGGLQRFNYDVIATFGDDDYKENVERRFESLMKYIDL